MAEVALGAITCTWMRRTRGKLPKLAEVLVSPQAAQHFRIESPRLLDKGRALRIIAWQAARGREATKVINVPLTAPVASTPELG